MNCTQSYSSTVDFVVARRFIEEMPSDEKSFSHTLLTDQLRAKLEHAIIFGDLPAETRLTEDSLAERYGISRSPVREALRRIEADGLLTRESSKRLNVAAMSRRTLDQVYMCRTPLEGIAAREAALHHSPQNLAALQDIFNRMQVAHEMGEVKSYFEAASTFTAIIHAAAQNPTLSGLLNGLGKQASRHRYSVYHRFPELIDVCQEGNTNIIAAIAGRDSEQARMVTEDLTKRCWHLLRGWFDV